MDRPVGADEGDGGVRLDRGELLPVEPRGEALQRVVVAERAREAVRALERRGVRVDLDGVAVDDDVAGRGRGRAMRRASAENDGEKGQGEDDRCGATGGADGVEPMTAVESRSS